MYEDCALCPRNCHVNRDRALGYCGQSSEIRIARAALHFWEEPELSGACEGVEDPRGSGTVFFMGCNLRCTYCQNYEISRYVATDPLHKPQTEGTDVQQTEVLSESAAGTKACSGRAVTVEELAGIFLHLQAQGALNINLVTAFMHMPKIACALDLAKSKGLKLPVVYNSSGYESVEMLRHLDGLIDVYLPDLKYLDADLGAALSHAADYPEVAKEAIAEMVRQTDTIVRHLVLPGHVRESKRVLSYLHETYGDRIRISIMSQYTPVGPASETHPELNRRITKREYDRVVDHAIAIGITNAYIQDRAVAKESFIPAFHNLLIL
ncbi:MAG: radical SAM protein [Lachnospiraceae bacterium]|nr:radical SAM protein [Lachnospiraceae bacterium]